METPTRRTQLPTHISDSTTQVGQDHKATGVLLILGTNKQPQAKTHQHAQRKLARLVASAAPVRPMACAGQTDRWTEPIRPMATAATQQVF
jgi:hypothetical protein